MLGKRLLKLRNERGLTQEQLSKVLGMSRSTYAQYEVNRREPDYDTLKLLANYFQVSVDYLLSRTDTPQTPEQKIESALTDDPELAGFWQELSKREDLQLLFKQVRPLQPDDIKRIIRIIKAIEDEEARN